MLNRVYCSLFTLFPCINSELNIKYCPNFNNYLLLKNWNSKDKIELAFVDPWARERNEKLTGTILEEFVEDT